MMKKWLTIAVLCWACAALAQQTVIPILISPGGGIVGALLLEDNASILLLEDNSSSLCLEGGC